MQAVTQEVDSLPEMSQVATDGEGPYPWSFFAEEPASGHRQTKEQTPRHLVGFEVEFTK